MPVRIKRSAEPMSFAARPDVPPHPNGNQGEHRDTVILASSQAETVLSNELSRYCEGLVRGRSFLIAGHRGSGKTTMVDNVVLRHQVGALKRQLRLKPLSVYVHGPMIFEESSSPHPSPSEAKSTQHEKCSRCTVSIYQTGPASVDTKLPEEDGIQERALILVAMALHQAVTKEYSDRFHFIARQRQGDRNADEICELAARFQIELTEAPPVSRLLDFWRVAGLKRDGILFDDGHLRGRQQGLREMIALTGVSHIYQRIAGKLEEMETGGRNASRDSKVQAGVDPKWSEIIKPLGVLAAGGAAGGITVASGHLLAAAAVSVIVALAAGVVLNLTTTASTHQERKIDRTFVPDLSKKTLHRVMPELFERLLAAGLAPVFIIDELDKVENLYERIHELLNTMKKLFAERAFTCLLTDRGFYEQLHLREELERASALEGGKR